MEKSVCLFFFVEGEFIVHRCGLCDAEEYGDFLIFPGGHFEIWEEHYAKKYNVEFDYYPRGRVAYNKKTETYQILYDRCIEGDIQNFVDTYYKAQRTALGYDEHYQCHKCNENYVM